MLLNPGPLGLHSAITAIVALIWKPGFNVEVNASTLCRVLHFAFFVLFLFFFLADRNKS